jgi:hypothetical protein
MREYLGNSDFQNEEIQPCNLEETYLNYFINQGGIESLENTKSRFLNPEIMSLFYKLEQKYFSLDLN